MGIVAGVDFGTQSVRVSIVDSSKGVIGHGVAEYPVKRDRHDPDYATQSHESHMEALAVGTRRALESAGVEGKEVRAIALDTTGSTVVLVDDQMQPLDDYLPLVRPPRQGRSGAHHRRGARARRARDRLVRRDLLVGVGLLQAPSLAPSQSRQTLALRHGLRALRHGRRGSLRHHRPL
jgi:sugar (pentulose or hexulose) kinase